MSHVIRPSSLAAILFALSPMIANAAMEDEIDHLMDSQASSGCTFVRNDISYSAREFQDHLRSKMRQNENVYDSTEEFIDKIATRSALSDSPYVALCDGELKIVRDWFSELLAAYRDNN